MTQAMFSNEIHVSAEDDTGGWRTLRLHRAIGYVSALCDHYGNKTCLDKIQSLHDCEGQLTVTWKASPTSVEKEFFIKAWESWTGDGASADVQHYLGDEEI